MRGRVLIAGVGTLAVIALLGGGAYVYFFSGLRTSPAQLGLSATPSTTASASPSTSGLAGSWTVASGSVAGYRVKELFVGESAKHEAVARTSMVTGGLTVSGDASSGYQISAITFTADLTDLHSVDSVVGRNVTQRDGIVSRQLDLQQFPNATFVATSASVGGPVSGQQVDVTVSGQLTIHGVTKDVTVKGKAQDTGGKIEIAGSLSTDMSQFGVSPPTAPFVTVDSQVVIEFDLFLVKG